MSFNMLKLNSFTIEDINYFQKMCFYLLINVQKALLCLQIFSGLIKRVYSGTCRKVISFLYKIMVFLRKFDQHYTEHKK